MASLERNYLITNASWLAGLPKLTHSELELITPFYHIKGVF